MKWTDIVELCMYTDVCFWLQFFYLPCRLACRLGLAAAWSLFKFKHTSLIRISLRPYASYYSVQPPFLQGWGQVQQQQAPPHRRGQQQLQQQLAFNNFSIDACLYCLPLLRNYYY
jgi:hypothetical protein